MAWSLDEAIEYYRKQGAPQDQNALVQLLQEIQQENGGGIPQYCVESVAQAYAVKFSFLLAVIRRFPRLRLTNTHCLEICSGPNCGKHTALAELAERLSGDGITVKFVPCMRLCGKGPNIRWDTVVYHNADEALLRDLMKQK